MVTELCREHGMPSATCYVCKAKFSAVEVSDAKRLPADTMLDNARLNGIQGNRPRTVQRDLPLNTLPS